MKAVILAGGLGTRLSEETETKPKPMVEIGGKPILWHIMKIYSFYGVKDFIICCGYKGYVIKEYFKNFFHHAADITVCLDRNTIDVHLSKAEPWRVTLVDTGDMTATGGRLKRVLDYLEDSEPFYFTYGDGLANIDISLLLKFHLSHGRLGTVCGVSPPARYGALTLDGSFVTGFTEKPFGEGGMVNGGFFVLSKKCLDYIDSDLTPWEATPMERLAAGGQLACYRHQGFWQSMDTLRDRKRLEALWLSDDPPWKVWA